MQQCNKSFSFLSMKAGVGRVVEGRRGEGKDRDRTTESHTEVEITDRRQTSSGSRWGPIHTLLSQGRGVDGDQGREPKQGPAGAQQPRLCGIKPTQRRP